MAFPGGFFCDCVQFFGCTACLTFSGKECSLSVLYELGNAMFGRLEDLLVDVKIGGTPLFFRSPPLALCFQKLRADSAVPRGGGGRDFTALGWGVLIKDGAQNGIEVTGSGTGSRG